VKLSALDPGGAFALLGPGFTGGGAGDGGFVLLRALQASPVDHPRTRLVFAPYAEGEDPPQAFEAEVERFGSLELDVTPAEATPRLEERGFAQAIHAIHARIADGDVYQVNLTQRCALGTHAPQALLARLCARGVPRFLAWVRLPDGTEVMSASPECFFRLDGRRLQVEPMKGTAPVDGRAALEASGKDRAELAMITDLMRNDLTPLCAPGSVQVIHPRRLLQLPYAVQTVSEVEGRLREGVGLDGVLRGLHPGGSVTGAPKRAAMALIDALETTPRGPYCGALVFREGARATASLLIRTAFRQDAGWVYGVGGGVTWRSTVEGEWRELETKLEVLR